MSMNPRLLRPTASGFNPRQIAGLADWWDASDSSTVTLNGTTVSSWANKATGPALAQATPGAQPTYTTAGVNGRNVLTFDGGDVLTATATYSTLTTTVLAVVRENSAVGNCGIFSFHASTGGDNGNANALLLETGSNDQLLRLERNLPRADYLGSGLLPLSVVSARGGGTGLLLRTDGVTRQDATGNTTGGTSTGILIGGRFLSGAVSASFRANMTLCEMLHYTAALSDSDIQRCEGYLAWKWGLEAQLPYDHPYARSFPGFGSQTTPSDSDTLAYLAAVKAADGTGVEVSVANAVDDFITGCKADGIWDAIKASCILAGARTLAGALVPLKGAAPTNNGPFVSGDYNRETGLVGNGTSKYLDSNRAGNADPQNSFHTAVYLSTTSDVYVAAAGPSGSGMMTLATSGARNRSGTAVSFSSTATAPTLVGHSRADASTVSVIANGTVASGANASNTPSSGNILLPGYIYLPLYSSNRMAFYSIGESLDLADLDARVSALVTAIGAAI